MAMAAHSPRLELRSRNSNFSCSLCRRVPLPYFFFTGCQHVICGACAASLLSRDARERSRCPVPGCGVAGAVMQPPSGVEEIIHQSIFYVCLVCSAEVAAPEPVHVCSSLLQSWRQAHPRLPLPDTPFSDATSNPLVRALSTFLDESPSAKEISRTLAVAEAAVSAQSPTGRQPRCVDWQRKVITVDGEQVSVEDIVHNAAALSLISAATENNDVCGGKWCSRSAEDPAHNIATCAKLHRMPSHVPVEGMLVPVKLLQRNRFVTWIAANPLSEGKWCTFANADHDAGMCQFAHRCPGVYLVDSKPIEGSRIVENNALRFLRENPLRTSRLCRNAMDHNIDECNYVHLRSPVDYEEIHSIPKATKRLQSAIADPNTAVTVDGILMRLGDLIPNAAADHLLRHPSHQGRSCALRTPHEPEGCKFIHRRTAPSQQSPEIFVDGRPVPVSELVYNRAVEYLLSHPSQSGQFCHYEFPSPLTVHDVRSCTYVHRLRPPTTQVPNFARPY